MKTNPDLTIEEFDQLMNWLDPDRSRAAERYEQIRNRLIRLFLNRQCSEAEDLADETINRVAKKPEEWKTTYKGEQMRYFHGVARNVYLEYVRDRTRKIEMPDLGVSPEREAYLVCLEICLEKLPAENKELIVPYYQDRKRAKIESHRDLGQSLSLNPGALRARVHRIRAKLKACIEDCISKSNLSNDNKVSGIYR